MAMPKSTDLHKRDASKLQRLTEQMKDSSDKSSPAKRRKAREERAQLMLSLHRAKWPLSSIARAAKVTLSVIREQIVVLPAELESVEVTAPNGDRVTPEPLPEEFEYGTIPPEKVAKLKELAPVARNHNFAQDVDSPEAVASAELDMLIHDLYEANHKPTDMARAIGSSNSLVRSRRRRAEEKLAAGK